MSLSAPWSTITDPNGEVNPLAVQDNFDRLFSATIGSGGRQFELRFGVTPVAFPAGAARFSAAVGVAHGLGRTPSVVVACMAGNGYFNYQKVDVMNWDAANFNLQCSNTDGTTFTATTMSVGWVALG